MAAGFPAKENYVTGEVLTAANMNDLSGTVNQVSGTQIAAGKNTVINGGFDVWQRGTTSSGNAYIADRWYSALVSGTGTFAQETTVIPSGGLYSMKFTASATAQPALYQAVEQLNTIALAGKTVTVSGVVAASTSVPMTIDVQHSSTADNSVTGTWTSITATSGGTATPTSTTFVSISGVYAIPSTAKSLRVRLFTTSTIASSVVVYFDNIQMEIGSTATVFARAGGTIQGELAACQRYFVTLGKTVPPTTGAANSIIASGGAFSTTVLVFSVPYPVPLRTTPIMTISNLRVAIGASTYTTGTWVADSTVTDSTCAGVVYTHGSAVFTSGQAAYTSAASNPGYMYFSAEL
jgi:hypothetical protein